MEEYSSCIMKKYFDDFSQLNLWLEKNNIKKLYDTIITNEWKINKIKCKLYIK